MIVHDILGDLATNVSSLIAGLLKSFWPEPFNQPVFGPYSAGDLLTVLIILLITLLIHGALHPLLDHKTKIAHAEAKEAKQHVLQASGRPLYLAVWILGLYFALMPALMKWPGHGESIRGIIDLFFDVGLFAAVLWFLTRLTHILERHLSSWAAKTTTKLDDLLVPLVGKSLRILVPVLGVIFALPLLDLPPRYADVVGKGSSILIIGAVAWILFEAVNAGEKVLLAEHDLKAADNLQARKIYTQVKLLGKTIHVIVGLCTIATILMLFQQVRHVGTSLLASAGIAGIIAGIAAQQTLANLFAGFQIALAQPIRHDDVVIVEGEWGRIEEITLTYVVVHIWDDRRMVLPLSYFITKPFQNWTRSSAQLMGSIFVWVDYSFPVDDARKALKPIVEGNPLWDGRFWNLQVSDATEKTMQLRILATASNSSAAWDLRCKIREDFIAYIKNTHPESLPRLRAEMDLKNTAFADAAVNIENGGNHRLKN
jgi:small-conductance mechanosensitive channel